MATRVTYQLADSIATITMDDGKVNALSSEMLGEINAALDQAVADHAVVVLTGRDGIFSAGFEVVVACPGHAMAVQGPWELGSRSGWATDEDVGCRYPAPDWARECKVLRSGGDGQRSRADQ